MNEGEYAIRFYPLTATLLFVRTYGGLDDDGGRDW